LDSKKRTRWWLWITLVVVGALAVVFGAIPGPRQALIDRFFNGGSGSGGLADAQVATALIGDLTARASARGQLEPRQDATLALALGGRVESVYVQVGDRVHAGDVLVELETAALSRAVRSAEQTLAIQEANLAELQRGPAQEDLVAAQAAVDSARAQLDALQEGPQPEEITAAEASVRAAEAAVWAAAEQRDQVASGPTEADIAAAEAQLLQAELQHKLAREAHDATMTCVTVYCVTISWDGGSREICGPLAEAISIPDDLPIDLPIDISPVESRDYCPALGPTEEQARYNMEAAYKNLQAAQLTLDRLRAGADSNQVGAAQANVAAAAAQRDGAQAQLDLLQLGPTDANLAAARAQLAQVEATLATLTRGVSDETLAVAEAQVEQARIALEEAEDNLAKASLTAPFDGVVTAILVSVGEYATGPAVELVDLDSLEVLLEVDEVDIGGVSVGQEATITLESWPDEMLTGRVISIAPKAQAMTEIVTYEVRVSFDPEGLPVLASMTANAELVTAERQGVLLVPNRAIIANRETGTYTVNRVDGDAVTAVEVTLGLRDSRYTEIRSGLEEGDRVVVGEYIEEIDFSEGPPEEVRDLR
jgi:HlyD family secretion protein